MRYCVIGDIGGHREVLAKLLARAGCSPGQGRIPDDLTVVQVGDLVHRGPDSAGVVSLVDEFLAGPDGDRWLQLAGNHEAQYVRPGGATFRWDEVLPESTIATLRRWWDQGWMVPAVDAGGVLVTHAGLTRGFWQSLGEPGSARETAAAINGLPRERSSSLWREGVLILGVPMAGAGPLWASASDEVIPGWLGYPVPFTQIMGHSSLVNRRGELRTDDPHVIDTITLLPAEGMGYATVAGRQFWCIDPTHTSEPAPAWNGVIVDQGIVTPLG